MALAFNGFNPACIELTVVSGATSGATFAISGAAVGDAVICALAQAPATGLLTEVVVSIPSAGAGQSTTDTSADRLIILWADASGEADA